MKERVLEYKGRMVGTEPDPDGDRAAIMRRQKYSKGRRCGVCDELISNDGRGCCKPCGIMLREQRKHVRLTMVEILPKDQRLPKWEVLARVAVCLMRRGIRKRRRMVMTIEEMWSILGEILGSEMEEQQAREIAERLWRVAESLGLEDGLAQLAVGYDMRREVEDEYTD